MYTWIYDGTEDEQIEIETAAEDLTGLGGVIAEWCQTGWGYGWTIRCEDEEDAEIVRKHMSREGFHGNLYRP